MISLVKRNLEQQVLKNQDDIEALKRLGMPGVKVTAVANSIEDITEPIVGAFYLVKNAQNTYNLYVYTTNLEFVDMGEFPKQGNQGPQGPRGPEGKTGTSTRWYSGVEFPTDNVKEGDMFLNISSYQVYIYSGGDWVPQVNIKGAAGKDGQNGNSITLVEAQRQGKENVVTIKTNKQTVTFHVQDGKPGAGFHIAHIYPDDVEGATMPERLPSYTPPDPDPMASTINGIWPAAESDTSEAVLVKTSQDGDYIYVILVNSQTQEKYYDNVGQVQSIAGPAGDPGDRIMDTEYITKTEAGAQYPNTYKLYINSIPYLNQAPTVNYTPNDLGFKIVMLPKSVESTTVRKNGYIYLFYEDPQTP